MADYAAESVVRLRFKYMFSKSNYKSFKPAKIASDFYKQLLINDASNDIVHVIDSEGNFLKIIEYPCQGGLSIDRDQNLVVADFDNRKIQVIEYLQ